MCKQAVCSTCQKSTWWGCGSHVPMVMDSIPAAERCTCEPKVEKNGKEYPPMGPAFNFGGIGKLFGFGGGNAKGGKDEL